MSLNNSMMDTFGCFWVRRVLIPAQVTNSHGITVWDDAQSRSWFHESTLGVGIMVPFMVSPPKTFTLGGAALDALQADGDVCLHFYQFHKSLAQEEPSALTERWARAWSSHLGAGLWQNEDSSSSHLANDNTVSLIGLIPKLRKLPG